MTKTVVCSAYLIALSALSAQNSEQQIAFKEVPKQVMSAVLAHYPVARITQWSKEIEDGKVTYEAAMIDGQAKREVTLSSDGAIVSTEEAIAVTSLPGIVKTAVMKLYPKTAITKAERITTGSELQYEVNLRNAPRKEILLSSQGKILKQE